MQTTTISEHPNFTTATYHLLRKGINNYTSNSFPSGTAIYEIEKRTKHSIHKRINTSVEPRASNEIQKTSLNTSFYILVYLELCHPQSVYFFLKKDILLFRTAFKISLGFYILQTLNILLIYF